MKPHTILYLLAAVFAAACAAGCAHQPWSGPILFNTTISQQKVDEKTDKTFTHVELEVLSLQKIGDSTIIYPPTGDIDPLELEPGDYRAKIRCDEAPSDNDYAKIMKPENLLRSDQTFEFSLKDEPDGVVQYLTCEVDGAGKVYVALLEGHIVVVD